MRPLTRGTAEPQRRRVGRRCNRRGLALGGEPVQVALEDMRHHKVGVFGDSLFDGSDRIADKTLQFTQRALVVSECCWRRAGQFEIESIVHGGLSVRSDGIQPIRAGRARALLGLSL